MAQLSYAPRQSSPAPRSKTSRPALLSVVALFIVTAAMASACNMNNSATGSGDSSTTQGFTNAPPPVATTPTPPPPVKSTNPLDALPGQEKNAVESGIEYLAENTGFSRVGLIQQLGSSAGEGYGTALATKAVTFIERHGLVNWNEQAVLSAKGYVALGPISCSELIQQLDSSAGEGFTVAQATYGAHHTSAC
ncbi:MAG TPA: Ltp family lipoprotein [Edaphobacter sp.]|nr:Ltp family lipoprotein [Edaphobacter sp.]